MIVRLPTTFLIFAALLVGTRPASALSPAAKCEVSKLGDAGKYDLCRLNAKEKAIKTNASPDYIKCETTIFDTWGKAETAAKGTCPTNGDETSMQAFINEDATAITTALAGGTLPEGALSCSADLATCGSSYAACNTNLNLCNANLGTCNTNYESCQSSLAACTPSGSGTILKTEQTTVFGPGSDGDLQKGVARSYTDNGDGTITDNATGLMWEKKSDDGSIHDFNNSYTWSAPCNMAICLMDGTITSTFLATLNGGGGFAGHTDWRIPNRFELETIMDLQFWEFANDPVFGSSTCPSGCTVTTCSCAAYGGYWSSSTAAFGQAEAWYVDLIHGLVLPGFKSGTGYVRAVRGGS